jgi:hypothetical protein
LNTLPRPLELECVFSVEQVLTPRRKKQLKILESALEPVSARLTRIMSSNSFCQHPQHSVSNQPQENTNAEILSLECAFEWLRLSYPEIYTPIVQMISDDQEEPLPLNWAVLVEDWDHTYWVVWLFTVLLISTRDGDAFRNSHGLLGTWLAEMDKSGTCKCI